MLDVALKFLRDEINAALTLRTGSDAVKVVLSRVADEAGKYAFAIDNIGCAIVNIEEERILKAQMPATATVNGQQVTTLPELKLNLHLLFAAHFTHYDQALKYLALLLTFFQAHPVFTSDQYPALTPACGKLAVDLISLNYEQLNQIWTYIGAKHLPSAVYRVRLVILQETEPTGIQPPLTTISATIHSR